MPRDHHRIHDRRNRERRRSQVRLRGGPQIMFLPGEQFPAYLHHASSSSPSISPSSSSSSSSSSSLSAAAAASQRSNLSSDCIRKLVQLRLRALSNRLQTSALDEDYFGGLISVCHMDGCWHMHRRAVNCLFRAQDEAWTDAEFEDWQAKWGECRVIVQLPRVAQKSYGSEKRFVCPPALIEVLGPALFPTSPLAYPNGVPNVIHRSLPIWLNPPRPFELPRVSLDMTGYHDELDLDCDEELPDVENQESSISRGECINLNFSAWAQASPSSIVPFPNGSVRPEGERSRDPHKSSMILPYGPNYSDPPEKCEFSIEKTCSSSHCGEVPAERWTFRNLWISDGEKTPAFSCKFNISLAGTPLRRANSLSSSESPLPPTFGRFSSPPVRVISKPSKKRPSANGFGNNPVVGAVLAGTPVSLFMRIRAQSVATKYLAVGTTTSVRYDAFAACCPTGLPMGADLAYSSSDIDPGLSKFKGRVCTGEFAVAANAVKHVFPGAVKPEQVQFLASSISWTGFIIEVVDDLERSSMFTSLPSSDCRCTRCLALANGRKNFYEGQKARSDLESSSTACPCSPPLRQPLTESRYRQPLPTRGEVLEYNQTVVLLDPVTGIRSKELIIRKIDRGSSAVVGEGSLIQDVEHPSQPESTRSQREDKNKQKVYRADPLRKHPWLAHLNNCADSDQFDAPSVARSDPVSQLHKVAFQVKDEGEYPGGYLAMVGKQIGIYFPSAEAVSFVPYTSGTHNSKKGSKRSNSSTNTSKSSVTQVDNGNQSLDPGLEGMVQVDVSDYAVWTLVGTEKKEFSFYLPPPQPCPMKFATSSSFPANRGAHDPLGIPLRFRRHSLAECHQISKQLAKRIGRAPPILMSRVLALGEAPLVEKAWLVQPINTKRLCTSPILRKRKWEMLTALEDPVDNSDWDRSIEVVFKGRNFDCFQKHGMKAFVADMECTVRLIEKGKVIIGLPSLRSIVKVLFQLVLLPDSKDNLLARDETICGTENYEEANSETTAASPLGSKCGMDSTNDSEQQKAVAFSLHLDSKYTAFLASPSRIGSILEKERLALLSVKALRAPLHQTLSKSANALRPSNVLLGMAFSTPSEFEDSATSKADQDGEARFPEKKQSKRAQRSCKPEPQTTPEKQSAAPSMYAPNPARVTPTTPVNNLLPISPFVSPAFYSSPWPYGSPGCQPFLSSPFAQSMALHSVATFAQMRASMSPFIFSSPGSAVPYQSSPSKFVGSPSKGSVPSNEGSPNAKRISQGLPAPPRPPNLPVLESKGPRIAYHHDSPRATTACCSLSADQKSPTRSLTDERPCALHTIDDLRGPSLMLPIIFARGDGVLIDANCHYFLPLRGTAFERDQMPILVAESIGTKP